MDFFSNIVRAGVDKYAEGVEKHCGGDASKSSDSAAASVANAHAAGAAMAKSSAGATPVPQDTVGDADSEDSSLFGGRQSYERVIDGGKQAFKVGEFLLHKATERHQPQTAGQFFDRAATVVKQQVSGGKSEGAEPEAQQSTAARVGLGAASAVTWVSTLDSFAAGIRTAGRGRPISEAGIVAKAMPEASVFGPRISGAVNNVAFGLSFGMGALEVVEDLRNGHVGERAAVGAGDMVAAVVGRFGGAWGAAASLGWSVGRALDSKFNLSGRIADGALESEIQLEQDVAGANFEGQNLGTVGDIAVRTGATSIDDRTTRRAHRVRTAASELGLLRPDGSAKSEEEIVKILAEHDSHRGLEVMDGLVYGDVARELHLSINRANEILARVDLEAQQAG